MNWAMYYNNNSVYDSVFSMLIKKDSMKLNNNILELSDYAKIQPYQKWNIHKPFSIKNVFYVIRGNGKETNKQTSHLHFVSEMQGNHDSPICELSKI